MWITFFSQTGKEIADIAESIGRWPDRIYTNDRPEDLRTVDPRIVEKGFYTLPNKPTLEDYEEFLVYFPEATITLHGWLRIIPGYVTEGVNLFNGKRIVEVASYPYGNTTSKKNLGIFSQLQYSTNDSIFSIGASPLRAQRPPATQAAYCDWRGRRETNPADCCQICAALESSFRDTRGISQKK